MAELLGDLNPGVSNSFPSLFTEFQGAVFFAANETEIWKTDGTSTGTVLIKDLGVSLGANAYIGEIIPANGQLAIGLQDNNGTPFDTSDDRVQLWKTDGTTSGTVLVKDFGLGSRVGGPYSSDATFLVELNGKVYGAVTTPANGNELWKSDLTSAGATVIVNDIVPGSMGSYPENLVALDGKLYFSANNLLNGRELWTSDGSSGGTVLLHDLNSGTYGSYPTLLTPFNGAYYFGILNTGADMTPLTPDDSVELWKTDGTSGGATMLDNFGAGSSASYPQLTAVGGTLFGVVDTAATGRELWKTDGTTGGAQLVKDISPGGASYGGYFYANDSNPYGLINVDGTLFFVANDGTNGTELWKSNGTTSGTVMVKDINPGSYSGSSGSFPYGSYPYQLTSVNGAIYFAANDGTNGTELWMSDGTSAGTVLVADINPGVDGYGNPNASYPYGLQLANGALYFGAQDATNGFEPWVLSLTAPDKIGIHRSNQFYLDVNGNNIWNGTAGGDSTFRFGNLLDTPIAGDWDGDGFDEVGIHRGNQFFLDVNGNGVWDGVAGGDSSFFFGNKEGDIPVVGDWDGDGADEIGIYRGNQFYLDVNGNGVWNGTVGGDTTFRFGNPGDTPIAGDWNGNGTDGVGIHRDNQFYLDVNANGVWDRAEGGDRSSRFGNPDDTPIAGDWDGDGADAIGIHRGNQFYLDVNGDGVWNGTTGGDNTFAFGNSGDTPIAGNWQLPAMLIASDGSAQAIANSPPLTATALAPIISQASAIWAATGLSAGQLQLLSQVQVQIADLPGATLGQAHSNTITLDATAAGYGWFVDATPAESEEFRLSEDNRLVARDDGPAHDRVDLLSAVLHELGHILGYDHDDEFAALEESLAAGVRRLL